MQKVKLFIYVILASLLASCKASDPTENKQLLGTWSEPYHVYETVKSITFNSNGTLQYMEKPDTTWSVIIDWGGNGANLDYYVKNNKLYISGHTIPYPSAETKTFSFATGYSIDGNTLTIDSFSYNGGEGGSKFYKLLILYKQ